MITNLQFIADNNISFSVSELNTDDTIWFQMEDMDRLGSEVHQIELSQFDLIKLRNWLNEAIEALDPGKAEAP